MIPAALIPILVSAGQVLAKHGMNALGGILESGSEIAKEAVVKKIEDATGIELNEIAADTLSPEAVAELRQFEYENRTLLLDYLKSAEESQIAIVQAEVEDRADARRAQEKKKGADRWFLYSVAYLVLILSSSFLAYAAFGEYEPSKSQEQLIVMVGTFSLGTAIPVILYFLFGTSGGSKEKQEQINEVLHKIGGSGNV